MTLNLENYRSSTEYREILRILQKSTTLEENFLWQAHALGKTVIPIQHLEIDFVSREVVISFDSHRFQVDEELPLYVKLDYRTTVFKIMNFRQSPSSVHFSFPNMIKTQELRLFPRHNFKPHQDRYIGLKSSMNSQFHKDMGSELNVRVLDISQYGLGLLVSEQNRHFLKNNRILWITSIQGKHLEYPILAEVVYMNTEVDPKFQLRRQKELKVGLKLSGTFPEENYKRFIQ